MPEIELREQSQPSKTLFLDFSREEILLLLIMFCVNFSHLLDFMVVMPLGPTLIRQFAITPQQFAYLVSAYTFMAGISGLLASLFVDRIDRKLCLAFFYVGFSAGTFACGFAWSFQSLLLSRSLAGLFGGVLASIIFAAVSDVFSYERRGTAMGVVMGAFSFASVIGVPLALALSQRFGWQAPFFLVGGFSILMLLLLVMFLPPLREHLQGGSKRFFFDSFIHIAHSKNQMLALCFMFFLILGQFSVIPFLSQSLVMNAGVPEAKLPLIYFFGGLGALIASPLAGRLADRFSKQVVFYIAVMVSLLMIWLITHLGPHPIPYVLFLTSIFFMTLSARFVPAMAMISATARPKHRGGFMSVVSSVQQFSAALASSIAGVTMVEQGGQLLHFELVGYIAIGCSIIAVLIVTLLQTNDE